MGAMERAWALATSQDGVITAAQCRELGLGSVAVADLCRRGRWRRLARGAYLPEPDLYPELSRRSLIRAAVASAGAGAVAVLGSAAELHGIAGVPISRIVYVSVPGTRPVAQRLGTSIHQLVLNKGDVCDVDGVSATTPLRTVADMLLRLERFSAVSVLDSALNSGLLTDLGAVAPLLSRRRGAVAARRWLTEADGRAQSPLETRVRLGCVDGGVSPEQLQYPVRSPRGALFGYGDLAWPGARVIAEADGAGPHGEPKALLRDRRRQNDFVNAGWSVLRFTWQDTLRGGYIPSVVRAALARSIVR